MYIKAVSTYCNSYHHAALGEENCIICRLIEIVAQVRSEDNNHNYSYYNLW